MLVLVLAIEPKKHIDNQRMMIRIELSNGHKGRDVMELSLEVRSKGLISATGTLRWPEAVSGNFEEP